MRKVGCSNSSHDSLSWVISFFRLGVNRHFTSYLLDVRYIPHFRKSLAFLRKSYMVRKKTPKKKNKYIHDIIINNVVLWKESNMFILFWIEFELALFRYNKQFMVWWFARYEDLFIFEKTFNSDVVVGEYDFPLNRLSLTKLAFVWQKSYILIKGIFVF